MKFHTTLIAAAALAVAAALASGSAQAQQKLVLKASDVHPAGYPTVAAVENLGKKMSDATKGRITVAMYPSMQLGGEKEAIEQAQVGAIAFARVSVGALGPVVDELNVFNLPYVFRNTEHAQKVMDGDIGKELLDKVTNSGKGLVGLSWMDAGARTFYDTKKPIKTMADLKGMKVRVMGNPMFVDMANSMGANGIAMGYDQVFTSLQTGVIDGADLRLLDGFLLAAQLHLWIHGDGKPAFSGVRQFFAEVLDCRNSWIAGRMDVRGF
jgi:tripartite ATP-independent transporter DctP family solute receptor